jgi:hypothetical protein
MYNKDLLGLDKWNLIDASGTFGKAVILDSALPAIAKQSFRNKDTENGYSLDLVDKADARRESVVVMTMSPKGLAISNVPEPRNVGIDVGDAWVESLNRTTTIHDISQTLNISYSKDTHASRPWVAELRNAVYGYQANNQLPNHDRFIMPPVDDVMDYMFSKFDLPREGVLQSQLMFVKYTSAETDPPGPFIASSDNYGGFPLVPSRNPGQGEIWFFVCPSSTNKIDPGFGNQSGESSGALYLKVVVDRQSNNWSGLDLWIIGMDPVGNSFPLNADAYTTSVKTYTIRADRAWKDLNSKITAVNGTSNETPFDPVPGRRELVDGFTRHNVALFDVRILGFPEYCQCIFLEGDVVIDEVTKTITVGRGIRQVEWMGSKLKDIVNLEDEEISSQEIADIEEFATKRVRTVVLPAQRTVPSDPLRLTNTIGDAEKGDVDLRSEIFAEADAERELPALTFDQASKLAQGKVYNMLHIVDDFGRLLDEQAVIYFNSDTLDVSLTVDGQATTIASYDDLWAYVWSGSKIVQQGSGATSFSEWLSSMTETDAASVEYFDNLPDGENSEWNETTVWPRVVDPSKLSRAELAAQEIIQFSRSRENLSQFISAAITQGRLAARSFTR